MPLLASRRIGRPSGPARLTVTDWNDAAPCRWQVSQSLIACAFSASWCACTPVCTSRRPRTTLLLEPFGLNSCSRLHSARTSSPELALSADVSFTNVGTPTVVAGCGTLPSYSVRLTRRVAPGEWQAGHEIASRCRSVLGSQTACVVAISLWQDMHSLLR